jgi:transposase
MNEGSWVGLDVHARSVVAGVIDQGSGEVRSLRVPAGNDGTVAWLKTLPTPVRVVYEAGPTGYGLARTCAAAGINCVVAAPSRIRPAADRVKTDRRDAERLARLLRLGEITPVRVPEPEEEAARDLVRAREDARGDLMRARHRLSKLLLRHGMVYDATAWTRAHDAWLRRQRFQSGPLAIVFDECYGRMLDAKTRRDALDQAIAELAAAPPYLDVVERLVCLRGVSTLTAFALTVELGDWHRFRPSRSARSSASPRARTQAGSGAAKAGSPRPATATHGGSWSRPPGSNAARRAGASRSNADGTGNLSPCKPKPTAAPAGCTDAGTRSRPEASRGQSSWSSSPASSPDTAGRSRRWTNPVTNGSARRAHRRNDARSDPRERCEQPSGPRSTPENGTAPHLAHPVMRHQPAHMSRDTNVDDSRCAPPAEPNPANSGANNPCPVDRAHSI